MPSDLATSDPRPTPPNICDALLDALVAMGSRFAFGLIGGAIVPMYASLVRSSLSVVNFKHETGACFSALEASLADDAPALVFVTTGPGLTNALTGLHAARREGAKILVVSGYTGGDRRGRFALQETHANSLGAGLYTAGEPFDYAAILDDASELPVVTRVLQQGFADPSGFVAHLALPLSVQTRPSPAPAMAKTTIAGGLVPSEACYAEVLDLLGEPFGLWLGFGARHASEAIRELVARCGAPVLATPRAKGIFDERDPHYLGVSGIFSDAGELGARARATGIRRWLVLGTRLGEVSSAYASSLALPGGLIHVDLDPRVPGAAFPELPTLAVRAELGAFVRGLLDRAAPGQLASPPALRPWPPPPSRAAREPSARVCPRFLIQHIQARVIDGSDAPLIADSGNAFAWAASQLRLSGPHRYRQPGLFCPMGHASAGAVGLALARGRRVVALVGDGAFLMQNELSTAIDAGAAVTWIVLNDARYGMVHQGLVGLGHAQPNMDLPPVNFVDFARAFGASGERVEHEGQLAAALDRAMCASGPHVLDVCVDREVQAPFGARVRSIDNQARHSS